MMDIGYGYTKYHDLYRLIKKTNNSNYIDYDYENQKPFKACDHIDLSNDGQNQNGITDTNIEHLTIETNARYTFNKDDLVYDVKNRTFWVVLSSITKDDGQAKEYSLRPRKTTIISMVKQED